MSIIMLIGGLVLIIAGANAMVSGASSIARYYRIPDLVIGLTIVAIGTSTPELAISIISAVKGNTDIAVGNVLGSNIANILVIVALSAIVYPLKVAKNTQYKEIPLGILAVLAVAICGNDIFLDKGAANVISRTDGLVLICFFFIFLYYTFQIATNSDADSAPSDKKPIWLSTIYVVGGIAGLYFGGDLFVEGAKIIARYLGMSDSMIGLTIVAIGTSLPELATSITAAFKKNSDIAIGNVIGSNILNIFLIMGITATIKPLPLQPGTNFDIGVTLLASLLLFFSTVAMKKRVITRVEGGIFFACYIAYIVYMVIRN